MSSNINLINNRSTEDSKNARIKKIKNFSFIFLFSVGFLSLLIFLINYRFSVSYVVKQEESLIKSLSVYDDTAAKILLLNSRLDNISTILSTRKKYNEASAVILKDTTKLVSFDSYQEDSSGISIVVSSKSLKSLNDFTNHLLKISSTLKLISTISLDSLDIQQSKYIMVIKAN